MTCHQQDLIGPAHDVYLAILHSYAFSHQPVNVSCKHAVIIRYLEDKDYITTHEMPSGDIFAMPSKRRLHKCN